MRHRALIALIAGLCAASPAQPARFGIDDFPPKAEPRVVSPELERKMTEARIAGFWVVEEGEYLYRIARLFARDDAEARVLERELAIANANAMVDADPQRLIVGSRLALPRSLVANPPLVLRLSTGIAQVTPTTAPIPTPPAAPVTPGAPAVEQAYVDKLIGGAAAEAREDREDAAPRREGDESPGVRSWGAELRTEMRDVSSVGRASTEGVIARYAQETERYGDFALLLQAGHVNPFPGSGTKEQTRGSATLFQENFALSSEFVAASALGVVRPTLPPWLSTSYRVFLSQPLINGFSTVVSSPDREIRFTAGGLGEYANFGVQQFVRIPGESASVTYSERLPGDWLAGGTAIAVHGSDVTPDRAAVSIAAQRGFQQAGEGVKFQGAVDDSGEKAGWVDAQKRVGRLTHRFGVYHVDPDFLFGQVQPMHDSRGAYWRGDYRSAGNFYSGGVEVAQDNLRKDPAKGGNDSAGAYGNVTLRLDRSMQVGGGLSVRDERPRTPTGIARDLYNGNLFFSRNSILGASRLDGNASLSRPDTGRNERTKVYNWNQDWNFFAAVSVSSLISYSDEDLSDRRTKRRTASLAARGPAYADLNWDANVTYVDAKSDQGTERNFNAALSLDWNPVREWSIQLAWYRNQIQPGPDNVLAPFRRENVVLLNVRYEDTAGTPYPRVAGTAGRSGSGNVTGSVFYDDNGDGVRQVTERGAPGVIVILDERQSATTDNEGRYRFALVPTGRHRVRVLLERVALPWGMEEESPREVEVGVRADSRLDIGLTRIAP